MYKYQIPTKGNIIERSRESLITALSITPTKKTIDRVPLVKIQGVNKKGILLKTAFEVKQNVFLKFIIEFLDQENIPVLNTFIKEKYFADHLEEHLKSNNQILVQKPLYPNRIYYKGNYYKKRIPCWYKPWTW